MKYNVSKVAVLGSGLMGLGITGLLTGAGIPVLLMDIAPRELLPEEEAKGLTLESTAVKNRIVNLGKEKFVNPKSNIMYAEQMADLVEVGNFTDDLHKLADCDLIIEAVIENLAIKQDLMERVDKIRKPGVVVATNTSGISVNEISKACSADFKQHFMGLHFFNPPRYMKLLEIVPTRETLPEIVAAVRELCEVRLGRNIIIAKDSPNFIANRIGHQSAAQALQTAERYGYLPHKADALLGPIIGRPRTAIFKTIDMSGLDVYYYALHTLLDSANSEYENTQNRLPGFVDDMLAAKQLGDKTGVGFYKKERGADGKEQRLERNLATGEYTPYTFDELPEIAEAMKQPGRANQMRAMVWGECEESRFVWENVKANLLYCAEKAYEIADSFEELDKAMMWGYNWTFGPFKTWDIIGVADSVKRMQAEGDTVPQWVLDMLAGGQQSFYENAVQQYPYIHLADERYAVVAKNEDAVLKDIGDGVLCFEFTAKGNALSPALVDKLDKSLDIMEGGSAYIGMVIANQGKFFSGGSNVASMAEMIENKDFALLEGLTKKYQSTFMRIKYARKPVITCPHGATYGGGVELAMHGHRQVAHVESNIGLLELSVGLIPGGGGTKEMLYRHTAHLGKAPLIEKVNAMKAAWEIIGYGKTSNNAFDAQNMKFLRETDVIVMSLDYRIDVAKEQVKRISADGYRPHIMRDIAVTGTTGKGATLNVIDYLLEGNYITQYDAHISKKLAHILAGGDVLPGTVLSEQQVLDLEREAFLSLCGEAKTYERIAYFLKTGKKTRN